MKSRKQLRDPACLIKKIHGSRWRLLCWALMFCFVLALSREGDLADFILTNRRKAVFLGVRRVSPDQEAALWCDRSQRSSDVCFLRGDVHVITGQTRSVVTVLHSQSDEKINTCGPTEAVRPYTRKWENQTMASVQPVELKCRTVERFLSSDLAGKDGPGRHVDSSCDKNNSHFVPAVLFSTAGFTGNPYHDFQDVLIPLFISSQQLKGEVVFVISDMRSWWVKRWIRVLHQLSRYPIVSFEEDSGQHCFPEVMVGLYKHKEFGLVSSWMPNSETMADFQRLLFDALAPPHLKDTIKDNIPFPTPLKQIQEQKTRSGALAPTPKLLILARNGTRRLLNQEALRKLGEELHFEVKVATLSGQIDLQTIFEWFYLSDVVMGVHGAELAHIVFMQRNKVVLQIVPLGTDWPSKTYYAGPSARNLGLRYMEYKIKPEESSLSKKYGLRHAIVRNPAEYVSQGWETQKQLYLTEQDVCPSPDSLRQILLSARAIVTTSVP